MTVALQEIGHGSSDIGSCATRQLIFIYAATVVKLLHLRTTNHLRGFLIISLPQTTEEGGLELITLHQGLEQAFLMSQEYHPVYTHLRSILGQFCSSSIPFHQGLSELLKTPHLTIHHQHMRSSTQFSCSRYIDDPILASQSLLTSSRPRAV